MCAPDTGAGTRGPSWAAHPLWSIALQGQLCDLRMQCLQVEHRFRLCPRGAAEHCGRTLEQRVAPWLDLVGMDVEILR